MIFFIHIHNYAFLHKIYAIGLPSDFRFIYLNSTERKHILKFRSVIRQVTDRIQKRCFRSDPLATLMIMKKVLKIFKITSIEIMKTECNLLFSKLRLLKKFWKYVIKIAKMRHLNDFIEYVSHNFFQNFIHHGFH